MRQPRSDKGARRESGWTQKHNHAGGGARAGAGRPKSGKIRVTYLISVEAAGKLQSFAKATGCGKSAMVETLILNKNL